jgi:transcriptional regulator with XRE-family HTH domain
MSDQSLHLTGQAETLSGLLRRRQAELGMTTAALAKALWGERVGPRRTGQLRNWIKGRHRPGLDALRNLAKALDVDPGALRAAARDTEPTPRIALAVARAKPAPKRPEVYLEVSIKRVMPVETAQKILALLANLEQE